MLENYIIAKISLFISLFYFSYTDFKYKKIALLPALSIYFLEIIFYIVYYMKFKTLDYISIIFSILSSIFLAFFAFISKEKLAYGDVLILSLLSMYMSFKNFLSFIFILIFFVGIISAFIIFVSILRKNYNKNMSIALVPFILLVLLFVEIFKLLKI